MTKDHENLKRLIESSNEDLAFRLLIGKGYTEDEAEYYIGMTKWAEGWRFKQKWWQDMKLYSASIDKAIWGKDATVVQHLKRKHVTGEWEEELPPPKVLHTNLSVSPLLIKAFALQKTSLLILEEE